MIAAGPHSSGGHKEAHVQGWLVSILLHGTVAFAAILLVKQIQLAPQDEPFKWNVAMVSPTQPVQQPTALPPNQAPARSVPSTTSAPSPPAQQTTQAQTLPSPRPLAQQATPAISERTVTIVGAEPPAPTSLQPTTPSQSAVHTTQPTDPIKHEIVAPMVAEARSIEKPAEAPMGVSSESGAQTAASSAPSSFLGQTAQSDQVPTPAQMAAISPVPTNMPTKLDYGWLSETILRRVEELKRYPASARVDRAEGKVVVKAVINEDGSIGEEEVLQSSGHPGLDKAAIETLRQAAPFHLPRPLGQPRMTIKIPMSYRLDR
ncbi:MAG: TonB family protein [Nitrospirae bacterium]|nr:MAG: TonB family protein [Nitrospirota bacterium]